MTENKTTGGDPETDIFSERTQLKPYEYPDVLEYKDAIRNSYWVHTEFNFSGDVQDFKVNTTPAEKTVIKRTMLAIAQIEVQVKTFWADIYDEMPKAEIGNVGMTFAESEVRHMDAYSHLLDILGITEDFEEVTDVPAIKERIDYLDEYLEKSESDDTQEYVMSLLLFSMFVEHVSLFSQFLIMTSFDKHEKKFKGITNAVEATSKEEQIHGLFGVELVEVIREENPDLFDEDFEEEGPSGLSAGVRGRDEDTGLDLRQGRAGLPSPGAGRRVPAGPVQPEPRERQCRADLRAGRGPARGDAVVRRGHYDDEG